MHIGSGNGLVPSGNKPLPEPLLTQTHVNMLVHVPLGRNEWGTYIYTSLKSYLRCDNDNDIEAWATFSQCLYISRMI